MHLGVSQLWGCRDCRLHRRRWGRYCLDKGVGMHAILAQLCAFSIAVTTSWLINRNWTFAGRAGERCVYEWVRYVAANSPGAAVNNSVYAMLMLTTSVFSNWPQLAVSAGSVAGMWVNFVTSRPLVFMLSQNRQSPG